MKHRSSATWCFLAIGLTIGYVSLQVQTPQPGKKAPKPALREQLLGARVLVGKPGNVGEPKPGARMKLWGEKHWVITQADPETGNVIYHHGGTYTLDGDKYVETITFANENTAPLIGKELTHENRQNHAQRIDHE